MLNKQRATTSIIFFNYYASLKVYYGASVIYAVHVMSSLIAKDRNYLS